MNFFRTPGAFITVNGDAVAGLVEAEVVSSNRYAADRFRADFALAVDSVATAAFWCNGTAFLVALSFSVDGGSPQELIRGYVDSLSFDFARNRVRLEGRDLASTLLDTRLAQTFPNRTSSEVATILASSHNLDSSVVTTTTLIGRYYQSEHDATVLDGFSQTATEWDLLTALARREGFNVFVSGNTLFFNPPQSDSAMRVIQPNEAIGLRLERSVTLAREISVTVKSWNSRQGAAIAETAQSTPSADASGGQAQAIPPLNFTVLRPNLTPGDAQQLAQRRIAELTPHQRTVEITLPGDVTLAPQDLIALAGTGTSFDQVYQIGEIIRTVGRNGFRQVIRAVGGPSRPTGLSSAAGAA